MGFLACVQTSSTSFVARGKGTSAYRQTTPRIRERVTSRYFETVVTADSTDRGKCSIKNFKSRCFFSKSHFMDSQINNVYSPTIFCVFLSDLMGFLDTSISPSDPTGRHIQ